MFFLKYIYNQQVKAGRIANDLAKRSDILTIVELHSATSIQRVNSLKSIVKVGSPLQRAADSNVWKISDGSSESAGWKNKNPVHPVILSKILE